MKGKIFRKASSAIISAAIASNCLIVGSMNSVTAAGLTFEFEDAEYTSDILTEANGLYMQDTGTITMTVSVEAAGTYDLVFYAYGEGGPKQQNVSVNGVSQGVLSIPKGSDYVACEMSSVKLNAGTNTITIEKSWGWSHFDKLVIEETVLPDIVAYDIVCSDPEIIPEAQSLMNYMATVYGEHIISGQQEIYSYGPHDFDYEFNYIENLTGELPAIRAFDYLNEANILYGSEDGTTDRMIDWVENKGGIITASWHITVPKDFSNFVLGETNVDWSEATYGPKDTDFDTSQILVEGSKEREYWMACLEDLAASIQRLEDRNIPLIFRPLHEAEGGGGETGSWFFWGQDGSAVYKELWRLTYDTLVKDYGLHNIIWEWNSYNFSTSTDWYPGDDYVDIIAYDKYSCTDWSTGSPVLYHNDSSFASTFYGIMEKYGSTKMVAMAENDSFSTLENITADKAGWLYFCTWYDGGTDNYGNSVNFLSDPIFNTEEDTINMYQSDYCITLDELPADLYSTVAPEVPTTTTTTTDPNAPVVTTTTPAFTFSTVSEQIDISDRTDNSDLVFVIEGAASASVGGGVGYGTSAADWVNIEWSGNLDADGKLEVTVPIGDIPAEFNTVDLQIWWSNVWDEDQGVGIDQPASIASWKIVDNSAGQTTTTTVSGDPDTETTTTTVSGDSTEVKADIELSGSDYIFTLDEAIGDTLYIELTADDAVTFANGCVGISAQYDGTNYWVAYQWSISGSDTVVIDLTEPYEISYNNGAEKVIGEELMAAVAAEAQKQKTGTVQIWWANDASGESIATSNVVLTDAYIIKSVGSTDTETTTTTVSDITEETTTTTTATSSIGDNSIEFTDVVVEITDSSITFEENGTFNYATGKPDKFSGIKAGDEVSVGLWYTETEDGKVINSVSYAEVISSEVVYGDADCNGKVEIADVVAIMIHISTPGGTLTVEAKLRADVYQRGDDISNMDALSVQKSIAQLITELPESFLV